MKAFLIILGSLAALYAIAAIVQLIRIFLNNDPGSALGAAQMAASIAPVCIGLAVSFACFKGAFGKPKP
jgi:uncharacterized membrane protein